MNKIFSRKYLKEEQLKGFDNYKYSCIDNSPIAVYISHPFWNWFVQFYPTWLAPNVITLCGAALVMGCYFFVSLMDPELTANSLDSPPEKQLGDWIWLVCSFCTFTAHLLDGTDGKQARRTGASGPTGELFDHGLDSLSTVPFTITIFSVFGLGPFSISSLRLLGILISVQLVFIVTHWEKYNTGVLFLSWAYDASQYGLSLFYLFTFFVGHKVFQFYVFDKVSFAHVFEFSFYVCCVLSFLMSFYNLYISYYVDKTGKQNNFYEFLVPMISPSILFAVSVLWGIYSPNKVIDAAPRLFLWTMGVVFSNIAVHLIISQMSCTRAQVLNKLLITYCSIAALAICGVFGPAESVVLILLAVVVTAAHVHYGVCIVRQLCEHFKIYAFSLKYLQKKNRSE
ncbi:CDP-alcohol phosphatidyltransferase domain-containing protein [Ditylenchus destructor]|nr:CDP-alcohol phosphatidyltransferase domain-containing protein [Ditylenchus destructor]